MAKKYGKCVVCGQEFEIKHGYRTKTCSDECLRKLRSETLSRRVEKKCKNCGAVFIVKSCEKDKNFCSQNCYWEYRRKHKDEEYSEVFKKRKADSHEFRKCEMCGKEFYVYKKVKKRFCSDECRIAYANTDERKEKRRQTMLLKYGKLSKGGNISQERIEQYNKQREAKYQELCKQSDMELLGYVERHVLHVKCKKCGAEFDTNNLSYIHYDKIVCKHCGDEYKIGKPASKIMEWLDECGVEYIRNYRKIIPPYEVDIYVPMYNIAIEVDGNFWHCDKFKDKHYHLMKSERCAVQGVKLIHLFEDEIINSFSAVQNKLISEFHMNEKISAKKCEARKMDKNEGKKFVRKNSLERVGNNNEYYGLFLNNEAIAVLSVRTRHNTLFIDSFASANGLTVVGGMSKLIKNAAEDKGIHRLIASVDNRWTALSWQENAYAKIGFGMQKKNGPKAWYVVNTNMMERKRKILTVNNEKVYRLWDCGSIIMEKNI